MDVEGWVSHCSTIVVDECPDRYDLTLRSLGCEAAVTTSGGENGKREKRGGEKNEGIRGREKKISVISGCRASQLGNVEPGGVLDFGLAAAQWWTQSDRADKGRRRALGWGPISTRARRITAITSVLG